MVGRWVPEHGSVPTRIKIGPHTHSHTCTTVLPTQICCKVSFRFCFLQSITITITITITIILIIFLIRRMGVIA